MSAFDDDYTPPPMPPCAACCEPIHPCEGAEVFNASGEPRQVCNLCFRRIYSAASLGWHSAPTRERLYRGALYCHSEGAKS